MTIEQCMRNEDLVPDMGQQGDCQQTHTKKGNTVTFEVTCPGSISTGEMTYTNDSVKGTVKSTQTVNGKQTVSNMELSGKYSGPCLKTGE